MDGIHDALVESIKIPDDDRFQRLYELEEDNFEYPDIKNDNVTIIDYYFSEDLLKLAKILKKSSKIYYFSIPTFF